MAERFSLQMVQGTAQLLLLAYGCNGDSGGHAHYSVWPAPDAPLQYIFNILSSEAGGSSGPTPALGAWYFATP
jgi:hypothetical protein